MNIEDKSIAKKKFFVGFWIYACGCICVYVRAPVSS